MYYPSLKLPRIMKHLLITIICLLVPILTYAESAVIEGINYYLDNSEMTAWVKSGDKPYSGEIIIPNYVNYNGYTYSVIEISNYAFAECRTLSSVKIGDNVTSIGDYSFFKCSGLTSIILPNSVKEIGGEAFSGCTNLQTIIIGTGLTYIWLHAFRNCSNLKYFYCLAKNVPDVRKNNTYNAFSGFPIENATLYVPEESVGLYKTDSYWDEFGTIIGLKENEVEEIVMGTNHVLDNKSKESLRFMLDGKSIDKQLKGINIVKMKDGKTRKVWVK